MGLSIHIFKFLGKNRKEASIRGPDGAETLGEGAEKKKRAADTVG